MKFLFQYSLVKVVFISLCMNIFPTSVYAAQHHNMYEMINFQKVSKRQAASIARKKYGGKVLNVKTIHSEGRIVYRVKLLLDAGRVKVVTVKGD